MLRKKIGFWVYMILALCSVMVSVSIKKEVSASSGSVITLDKDKYTKYDITNDGKKDIIQLKKEGGEAEWYDYYRVYINRKCALSIRYTYFSTNVKFIRFSNNKSYLFIHLGSDNDIGPWRIYAYSKGKLVKKIDMIKSIDNIMGYCGNVEIRSVKGNKMFVNMVVTSYGLGNMKYEAIYEYRAGDLGLQSKKHKILGYFSYPKHKKMGIYTLTSTKAIQLYKNATLKQKLLKLKAGTKMKVKKCYISGKKVSFYVETLNGVNGWFKSPKSSMTKLFNENLYVGQGRKCIFRS